MSKETLDLATGLAPKVAQIAADVASRNIGRESIVTVTLLSLISGRPAFFLGTPGINKTGTVQAVARAIDGAVFQEELMPTIVSVEQLLVESTAIVESSLTDGSKSIATRDTLGRAATAHLFFADEIWKAEPRVLQTLLDLAKGDGVRHEGRMVATPLLSFLAASNELPDSEGNLGAMWSRMTLRAVVRSLDAGGKRRLVASRLKRDRAGGTQPAERLTLAEVELLREARPHVAVGDDIVETVMEIYTKLMDDSVSEDFQWLWDDDRRFGRIFDVLQAKALLEGRQAVEKTDLSVLEHLLWDTPEQIPVVKGIIAPYCRTALTEAKEILDTLLAPGGTVERVIDGDRSKGVQAITQCEEALRELKRLRVDATGAMCQAIDTVVAKAEAAHSEVTAVVTGARRKK